MNRLENRLIDWLIDFNGMSFRQGFILCLEARELRLLYVYV